MRIEDTAAPTPLVRVTVSSGTRRVDLVLPGAVPVAELVPELARCVGLLDVATVHGGYRIVVPDGRQLATDAGLSHQGVEDGALLTLHAGGDDVVPPVYDDVVEAMLDVTERDLRPWTPASGRRAALGATAGLLALSALALLAQGAGAVGGSVAVLVALVLTVGGVGLARVGNEPAVGAGLVLLAAPHAAVAGLLLTSGDIVLGWPLPPALLAAPLAAAGAGLLVVGVTGLAGLAERRAPMVPVVGLGAILGACGVLHRLVGYDPAAGLPAVMTVLVLAGSLFPSLAVGATSTRVDELLPGADDLAGGGAVDVRRVAVDARLAHEVLLGLSVALGVVLVLVAPLAVGRGVAGTALAVSCCATVMLRTRRHRSGQEVLAGILAGGAGLASTLLAVLVVHDGWRTGTALALASGASLLLVMTLAPVRSSARRDRLADVAESLALLSLLPLTVVATGLMTQVAG